MSDTKEPENLSEILFKPQRTSKETSVISNSDLLSNDEHLFGGQLSSYFNKWYRPVYRFFWTWLGGNILDIDEALAKIASSDNKRSRENCLDTVIEYGPGNWIYEFSAIAQERYLKAKKCLDSGDTKEASHNFRMASRYFSLASFPNLKGDVLASEAAILGRKAYREIFSCDKSLGYFSEETFKVRDVSVKGFLHCPDKEKLSPCVVIAGTYWQSAIDYLRIYTDYLFSHGIGVFILDLPGVGGSVSVPLDANSSDILEAGILHLKDKVPFIDNTNIGVVSHSVGCNGVVRLAILRPDLIKAMALISPMVDKLYTNQEFLNEMPLCNRASLANRMGLDAVNWSTIVPQLSVLSLKVQGLLSIMGNNGTECLICDISQGKYKNDDVKLLQNNFKNNYIKEFKKLSFSSNNFPVFLEIEKFFCQKFGINS